MNIDANNQIITEKRVVLKPYVARPFKQYELATNEEIWQGAGGTLIVDTENYNNYFLIAFKDIKTKKVFKLELISDNLSWDSRKLSWIMHSYKTIGFNSLKYDLPLIWLSYFHQDLEVLKDASNWLIREYFHKQTFETEYNIQIFNTAHIDLIEVCPLRGSLKLYGGRLHAQRIQDVPFDPYGDITPEQIAIVSDYCVNDLDITELAYDNLKEQLALREELSKQYRSDLMSKSDAQIAESVIANELKSITNRWPKKPQIETSTIHQFQVPTNIEFQTPYLQKVLAIITNATFSLDEYGRLVRPKEISNLRIHIGNSIYRMGIGGLHSSEENINYKSNDKYQIYDRDVASYYPRIVLNCKLYPKHLGENFLQVYNAIVDRRLEAKQVKNIAVAECLKITINGTFGKTGSPHSFLYAPEMTIQITVCGQLYLLMLIELLELAGIQVISANTDGILVYCERTQVKLYESLVKLWEQQTGFITEETKYKAYYARDVNAYLAIKENDETKGKNVYYDPWRGKSAKDLYWQFQKNPTAQICIEAIENLLIHGTKPEETIKTCREITKFICIKNVKGGAHKQGIYLGKVVRWYYSKHETGTINYITNGNKVSDTEGARPCMDLLQEWPIDINYDWYIKRTTDLLYDMAYLERPKQYKFF